MEVRRYGDDGPVAILIHGGPGAPGYMATLAVAMADSFRVWEPWQRPSGDASLTVGVHVEDLHELVMTAPERPALVGHSWGAMLALAYAAARPEAAGPIALIGCGTWDSESRARYQQLAAERPAEPPPGAFDARAHQETWDDMLRLQREGVYPAAFAAIRGPVLMLHGAEDPHPGRMILASLRAYIPQIEYRELEGCGHYPWLERNTREAFLGDLKAWLLSRD